MPKPKTLPALTSLRFFAALWVVLYHGMVAPGHLDRSILAIGFVAVPFFFLLSGFILAHVYLSQGAPVQGKRFLANRFARVYPLYAVSLLLDLPHYLHTSARITHVPAGWQVASVAATFAMLQGWNIHLQGLNTPSWSLSAEAFFYLLFPLLGPTLYRTPKRWLLPLLCALPVLGLALTAATTAASTPTYDPLRPLPMFLIGILLNRLSETIAASRRRREWLQRAATPLLALCLLLLVASVPLGHSHYAWLQNGLLAPVFALLILAFTVDTRISNLLSNKTLVLLGEASFALYLLHVPVAHLIRAPMEQHFTIVFPTYVLFVILLSIGSFLKLEKPARVWVLQRLGYLPKESLVASSIAQ